MNQHIYLRAYMAGVVVPTIFLLVVATVFTIARYVYDVPVPVERVIVFPMAVVPNVWGLWNVLFLSGAIASSSPSAFMAHYCPSCLRHSESLSPVF